MPVRNVELRQNVGGIFNASDNNSLVYVRTHINQVVGLLEGGKLAAGLIPNYLLNGLRPAGTLYTSTGITTLTGLKSALDTWVTSNGGAATGVYYMMGDAITLAIGQWHEVNRADDGDEEQFSSINLETNDWIIFRGGTGIEGQPFVWDIINNTYNEATQSVRGLMSSTDKVKLDGLSNYTHPSYSAASQDLSNIETVDQISIVNGHISAISTQAIRLGSTSQLGLVQLETNANHKIGFPGSDKAATPAGVKGAIEYWGKLTYYTDIAAANAAVVAGEIAAGAFALVQV